jgi:hypothetical protein
MVHKGAINYDRLKHCKSVPDNDFCGIKQIDLDTPEYLKSQISDLVKKGAGKRVELAGWKAGRTIDTANVIKLCPELFSWYKSLEDQISNIIQEKVYVTQEHLPTTCAVLIYEKNGDFINWHYDVNYFNGRFFTLLIPCNYVNTCTRYTYYDKNNSLNEIALQKGKSILFEGDKVFHMATKFCNEGESRIIISVQFTTDPGISFFNRALMRLKDVAYIGVFA